MNTIESPSENGLIEVGNKISTGLAAFEIKKSELEELKKEVEGLDITSIDDKASIKTVSEARKKLKSARIEIEKDAKAMRDGLTERSRFISQKEKELVDIIEPTEKELLKKEKWIKDENDRIEREAKEAEEKIIQDRIDRLATYDCEINLVHLKGLADEEFDKVVASAKKQFDLEQAEIKEQERIKEENRKELEQLRQQKAESDRIIKEQQDKIEADRLGKEKRDKEDADRIQMEKDNARTALYKNRVSQLNKVLFLGENVVANYDTSIVVTTYNDLVEMDEDKFNSIRDDYNKENDRVIEAARLKKEQDDKEAEDKRLADLEKAKKEAADKAILDKKAKEEEDARLEAERVAAASDKEKFNEVVKQLRAVTIPEMKSVKHKKLSTEVQSLVTKIIDHIKAKA